MHAVRATLLLTLVESNLTCIIGYLLSWRVVLVPFTQVRYSYSNKPFFCMMAACFVIMVVTIWNEKIEKQLKIVFFLLLPFLSVFLFILLRLQCKGCGCGWVAKLRERTRISCLNGSLLNKTNQPPNSSLSPIFLCISTYPIFRRAVTSCSEWPT